MKIAVTYEDGKIFQHFGHTENFMIYEVTDGKIIARNLLASNGSGHGALAELLARNNVDALICGGIGGGAKAALEELGIALYGGVAGDADQAVEDFISGNLAFNPDIKCSHHEHEHGEGHSCGNGDHSCGGHDRACGGCKHD